MLTCWRVIRGLKMRGNSMSGRVLADGYQLVKFPPLRSGGHSESLAILLVPRVKWDWDQSLHIWANLWSDINLGERPLDIPGTWEGIFFALSLRETGHKGDLEGSMLGCLLQSQLSQTKYLRFPTSVKLCSNHYTPKKVIEWLTTYDTTTRPVLLTIRSLRRKMSNCGTKRGCYRHQFEDVCMKMGLLLITVLFKLATWWNSNFNVQPSNSDIGTEAVLHSFVLVRICITIMCVNCYMHAWVHNYNYNRVVVECRRRKTSDVLHSYFFTHAHSACLFTYTTSIYSAYLLTYEQ